MALILGADCKQRGQSPPSSGVWGCGEGGRGRRGFLEGHENGHHDVRSLEDKSNRLCSLLACDMQSLVLSIACANSSKAHLNPLEMSLSFLHFVAKERSPLGFLTKF